MHATTIKASEFKAKCLQLMDEVNNSGKEIIITKNGKPVSKLVQRPYYIDGYSRFSLIRASFVVNRQSICV